MFQNLFRIMIKPKDTLDRLLFEENMRKSWAAMWLIVLVGACSTAITLLVQGRSRAPGSLPSQLAKVMPSLPLDKLLSVGIVLFVGVSIVGYLLGRLLFPWYVRMGLRMVAGDVYPKSREERRAKGRLVRLLYPYLMGIYVLPGFVIGLLSNFILANQPTHVRGQSAAALVAVSALLQLVTTLITLGLSIYMIVVRVIAIRKIYQVSAAQAFLGPFLIYFFTWFLFVIVTFVVTVVIVLYAAPHLHPTM